MKSRQLALFPALLPVLLGAPAVVATAGPSPSTTTASAANGRWVAETPDAMIEALAAKGVTAEYTQNAWRSKDVIDTGRA